MGKFSAHFGIGQAELSAVLLPDALAADQSEELRVGLKILLVGNHQTISVDRGIRAQAELAQAPSDHIILRQMRQLAVHAVEAHPAADAVLVMMRPGADVKPPVRERGLLAESVQLFQGDNRFIRDNDLLGRIEPMHAELLQHPVNAATDALGIALHE